MYRGVQHVQNVATHLRFGDHATLRVLLSANTALQLVPGATAKLLQRFSHFESVLRILAAARSFSRWSLKRRTSRFQAPHWTTRCSTCVRSGGGRCSASCQKSHALLARKFDLASALRQRLIIYSPEAPQSQIIDAWLEKFGIARQVAVEVRSGYAACAMAASGAGVAFVDDLSARAHRSENLALIKIPDAPRFAIYSVTNVNRPPSQLGQTFLELVTSELASFS
ncbi:hypothetical protein J7E62_07535 [Variovorax paradoxus]|nr:hypothetical protein [Variovorax paradoxus]